MRGWLPSPSQGHGIRYFEKSVNKVLRDKKKKDIWIAETDYYMYFYIIVLFPLTSILQLINFTMS